MKKVLFASSLFAVILAVGCGSSDNKNDPSKRQISLRTAANYQCKGDESDATLVTVHGDVVASFGGEHEMTDCLDYLSKYVKDDYYCKGEPEDAALYKIDGTHLQSFDSENELEECKQSLERQPSTVSNLSVPAPAPTYNTFCKCDVYASSSNYNGTVINQAGLVLYRVNANQAHAYPKRVSELAVFSSSSERGRLGTEGDAMAQCTAKQSGFPACTK